MTGLSHQSRAVIAAADTVTIGWDAADKAAG